MGRLPLLLLAALCGACGQTQTSRTIPYRADVPIADRLEPGDTRVVVEMKASPPPETTLKESFDQEIQRLKKGELVLLVRVSATRSEIADRGTWIRTIVNAEIERVIRTRQERDASRSVEFMYSAGSARIGNVEVSTGKFPRFEDGERYLVLLRTRHGTESTLTWSGIAFRVDADGTLRRIGINDGSEQSLPTNLAGRNISEVADALAR